MAGGKLQLGPFEVDMVDKIGQGSFGVVYKGRNTVKDFVIAAKQCDIKSDKAGSDAMDEIKHFQSLENHPHIVELYDFHYKDKALWMIMEFCDAGDLEHYFKEKEPDMKGQLNIMYQSASAISYMHCQVNTIIHRDIKPGNLLMKTHDGQAVVKVTDFGLSKIVESADPVKSLMFTTKAGTPGFMAPEFFLNIKYNKSVDVFALGLVFLAMIDFKRGDDNLAPVVGKILLPIGAQMAQLNALDIPIPEVVKDKDDDGDLVKSIKRIIKRMTNYHPKERCHMRQVVAALEEMGGTSPSAVPTTIPQPRTHAAVEPPTKSTSRRNETDTTKPHGPKPEVTESPIADHKTSSKTERVGEVGPSTDSTYERNDDAPGMDTMSANIETDTSEAFNDREASLNPKHIDAVELATEDDYSRCAAEDTEPGRKLLRDGEKGLEPEKETEETNAESSAECMTKTEETDVEPEKEFMSRSDVSFMVVDKDDMSRDENTDKISKEEDTDGKQGPSAKQATLHMKSITANNYEQSGAAMTQSYSQQGFTISKNDYEEEDDDVEVIYRGKGRINLRVPPGFPVPTEGDDESDAKFVPARRGLERSLKKHLGVGDDVIEGMRDMKFRELVAQWTHEGTIDRFEVGDQVIVLDDYRKVDQLQDGFGGFNSRMAKFLGKYGIVKSKLKGRALMVLHDDGNEYAYNPKVLSKTGERPLNPDELKTTDKDEVRMRAVQLRFRRYDVVKLSDEKDIVKLLQEEHGGWNEGMNSTLGVKGLVNRVDSDGDVYVEFINGDKWTLNPEVLIPCDAQKGPVEVGDYVIVIREPELAKHLQCELGLVYDEELVGHSGVVQAVTAEGIITLEMGRQIVKWHPSLITLVAKGEEFMQEIMKKSMRR